jgi:DNA polymerase IV
MRIAAVYLSHFASAVEARRRLELRSLPVVIADGDPPRRVGECSPQAIHLGVFSGMAWRQAQSRCPSGVFLLPDSPYYDEQWQRSLVALTTIGPEVENALPGQAFLNVNGLAPLYGSEQALSTAVIEAVDQTIGLRPSVGIAEGKFTAYAAAAQGDPGACMVVGRHSEAAFLSPINVSLLPLGASMSERLHLLGLHHVGDVADLPLRALVEQFGLTGKRLWQLANGIDEERLVPWSPATVLEDWLSFDAAVVSVEVLVLGVCQLLSRLSLSLGSRGCRELEIRAELANGRGWQRRIVLREAVSEQERLQFVLRTALREAPPAAPVQRLGLRITGLTGESGRQLGLGDKRESANLTEALRQLKARYGHSPIYHCVEVEPWSQVPEDRYLLVESDT